MTERTDTSEQQQKGREIGRTGQHEAYQAAINCTKLLEEFKFTDRARCLGRVGFEGVLWVGVSQPGSSHTKHERSRRLAACLHQFCLLLLQLLHWCWWWWCCDGVSRGTASTRTAMDLWSYTKLILTTTMPHNCVFWSCGWQHRSGDSSRVMKAGGRQSSSH